MRQLPPTFGAILDPALFTRTLNLETADLDDRSPVQVVSTGLPALIVPLRDLDALRRCKVDWGRYTEVAQERTYMSSARNHTTTVQAISRPACSQTTSVSPKIRRPAAQQAAWPLTCSNIATSEPTP